MLTRYCLLDLETVALDNAREWLPKIVAPANYSKPETINAYVQGETMKALDSAALDPETCRIVCVGVQANFHEQPQAALAHTEAEEFALLTSVWNILNRTTPMVGYGLTFFDAGVLVRRSQLLGVRVPSEFYKQGKYRHDWIVELSDYLTLNGMIEQKKGRGLDYHCTRLGITVDDPYSGKDVAQLWRDGNHEAIQDHCLADLMRIRALAERIGVIERPRAMPLPITPISDVVVF
jgi:predicted 3'-5' exonuclease similar to PolB exonuclease domain